MTVTGQWTDSGGTVFREIGGVIRNTDGIWFIVNDATHKSLNLTAISASSSWIFLDFPSGTWIGPMQVTTDETYAALGLFVGASVTQTRASIAIYRNVGGKTQRVNPLTLKTALGDFWVRGLQFV